MMQVYVLHAIQMLFAAISRVAPGVAAKIAWFLLSHPDYFKFRTTVENELLELAEPLKASADALSVVTTHGAMRVYHWMPDDIKPGGAPVAILVHGWGGCGLYMTQFVPPLLNAGYQVAAIDLPGHGGSQGASTDAGNTTELVLATARALGRADLLLGHSFGALAVMLAAAGGAPLHDKITPKKLVLLSAPASLEGIVRRIARLLNLSNAAENKLIERAENNLDAAIATQNAQSLLDRITCPVLAIHDENDFEIPLATSLVANATCKNMQTLTTGGLGHRRALLDQKVISAVAGFARKR
jgi:pimeloyl-ACP methyl ester carboxylesterase